jgi:myosin heavy subunit
VFVENEMTEAATIFDEEHAKFVAQLLLLPEDSLLQVFSTKTTAIRGESITKTLTAKESYSNKDATSKRLFGELFIWIIARLNECLAPPQVFDGTDDNLAIGTVRGFDRNLHSRIPLVPTPARLK